LERLAVAGDETRSTDSQSGIGGTKVDRSGRSRCGDRCHAPEVPWTNDRLGGRFDLCPGAFIPSRSTILLRGCAMCGTAMCR
jgi:hypothetical protein